MNPNGKRRHRLCAEQQGLCWYCQITLTLARGRDNSATVDHLIPRCLGGTRARHNTVAACLGCNRARGVMLWFSYRGLVKRRGRKKAHLLGRRWNARRSRSLAGLCGTARKQHATLLESGCAVRKIVEHGAASPSPPSGERAG